MKKIIVILGVIFLLCGCGSNMKEISKLDKILQDNNYIILDVRTNEEYKLGHVKNSINIPYDEINSNVELDENKTILVYCKSGVRSKIAYDNLTSLGYDVYDLGSYDNIKLEKE